MKVLHSNSVAALITVSSAFMASMALAQPGVTHVANWEGDKKTAFLLMFDDSVPTDLQNVIPELQKRKMAATFYINPGLYHYKKNSEQWEKQIPKLPGVVFGNHTLMHDGLKDYASADADLKQVNALIVQAFPGKETRLISFAKPGVAKEKWTISDADYQKVLNENHLIAREEPGLNAAQFNGLTTADGMLKIVDDGITKGTKRAILFHGIGGDWLSTPVEVLNTLLDGLEQRREQVWVTDHISAHKYETERKTAKVKVLEASDKRIRLELEDEADSQLYDAPLTLVTEVPATWKQCQISQGAKKVIAAVDKGSVQFDALPDGTAITLQPV